MAYIGNTPADKYQTLEKQSFTTSATTGYTLSYSVSSPQDIALYINNVRQNPNSSYTVSNTALTLSSATSSSDVMYAVFLGKSVGTVGVPVNGVGTSQIADNAVTSAKLASGLALGKIGQVVQTYIDSVGFETTSSSAVQITGLTANITPSATSSKILVLGSVSAGSPSDYKMFIQLRNGTTLIGNSASAGNRDITIGGIQSQATNHPLTMPFQYLHSPSSTDQQTYNVYGHTEGSGAFKLNKGSTDTDASTVSRSTSALTLMEVLA